MSEEGGGDPLAKRPKLFGLESGMRRYSFVDEPAPRAKDCRDSNGDAGRIGEDDGGGSYANAETSGTNAAVKDLDMLPITEVFDHDSRPTFILDLDPDLDSVPNTTGLSPIFYNSSLRSYDHLREIISGDGDVADAGMPDTIPYATFRTWALSVTPHDTSRDVWPTTFLFCGMLWTGSTIRRRFRLISGNRCYSTSSIASGDLSMGPPPETAASILRNPRPATERTTSGNLPRFSNASKGTLETNSKILDHSAVPASSSQSSLETMGLVATKEPVPEQLLCDWTVESPSAPMSKHIEFVRSIDWSGTPLGAMETWSPEFRQIANLVMQCPHPVALFWGDDLTMMYNEAYKTGVAGIKDPHLMGTGFQGPFSELWDFVEDIFAECRRTGKAVSMVDQLLPMMRYGQGFLEETYFSWCFVPLYGGTDHICGFYNAPFETTDKIISARRTKTLRKLGAETATAKTVKQFWPSVLRGLEENTLDAPFALLYSVSIDSSDDGEYSTTSSGSSMCFKSCVLEGCLGVPRGHPAAPEHIDLKRSKEGFIPSFREAMRTREPTTLQVRDGTLPEALLEDIEWRGWPEPCREATIFPLRPTNGENVLGFLLLGTNPRLPYNDGYESFVNMLSRQLATGLASMILFEDELRRGEFAAEAAALERERLSEQLAMQVRRFQKMSELASVGLFILDPEGVVIEANETWWKFFQLVKGDSRPISWLDSIAEESKTHTMHGWEILTKDQKGWSGELKLITPWSVSGEIENSWLLASAHPEFDADGTLIGVIGSVTDVSHLKWAESLQARRLEEAEETRRQQNNFIDITSHEMRNPLSAILQCADDVSMAMDEVLDSANPEVTADIIRDCKEAAETIAFCAQHQKSIVDDILTISKLDSDLLVMTPAVVQPFAVAQRSCKMFEADALKKGIHMSFSQHETFSKMEIDYVTMDANRVMQILINLITNAIKFTQSEPSKTINVRVSAFNTPPESGISGFTYVPSKLSLENLARVVDKEEWGTGEPIYIGFVVEDTGRGLDLEEKKNLFLRFSQASPRTHAKYGGSGLGLFISRQLTELHGGRIGVASEYGVGSQFGFYVRARRADSRLGGDLDATLEPSLRQHTKIDADKTVNDSLSRVNSRTAGKSAQPHTERKKVNILSPAPNSAIPVSLNPQIRPEDIHILVVEDNLLNQKVLCKQLVKLKYNVTVANHGGEALGFMETTSRWTDNPAGVNLSLILMDLEMPVMNGEAAARNIRQLENNGRLKGHVPIIAVSANVRLEQVNAARESGMDDVVSKPFRIPELVAKMNDVLQLSENI